MQLLLFLLSFSLLDWFLPITDKPFRNLQRAKHLLLPPATEYFLLSMMLLKAAFSKINLVIKLCAVVSAHLWPSASLASSCVRCSMGSGCETRAEDFHNQRNVSPHTLLTWLGTSWSLYPGSLPLYEVKATTADILCLQFGSVLRKTSSLLIETGKEGQVWEHRAPEHSGKLWGWSCHLMGFGWVYYFGLGWGFLLIGIGVFADKAWFSKMMDKMSFHAEFSYLSTEWLPAQSRQTVIAKVWLKPQTMSGRVEGCDPRFQSLCCRLVPASVAERWKELLHRVLGQWGAALPKWTCGSCCPQEHHRHPASGWHQPLDGCVCTSPSAGSSSCCLIQSSPAFPCEIQEAVCLFPCLVLTSSTQGFVTPDANAQFYLLFPFLPALV